MRTRKSEKRYIEHKFGRTTKTCPFCTIKENEPREIHEETTYFYRVENIFGYDVWDGYAVSDHQMIVPKRHITSFSDMNDDEKSEYLSLVLEGEKEGYCVYTRGVNGPSKSVAHAHSHLIKLDTSRKLTNYLFVRKPHLVLFRTSKK